MNAAEQVINDAVREVIGTIRLGRRIGRTVPTSTLSQRLQLAADEADTTPTEETL